MKREEEKKKKSCWQDEWVDGEKSDDVCQDCESSSRPPFRPQHTQKEIERGSLSPIIRDDTKKFSRNSDGIFEGLVHSAYNLSSFIFALKIEPTFHPRFSVNPQPSYHVSNKSSSASHQISPREKRREKFSTSLISSSDSLCVWVLQRSRKVIENVDQFRYHIRTSVLLHLKMKRRWEMTHKKNDFFPF